MNSSKKIFLTLSLAIVAQASNGAQAQNVQSQTASPDTPVLREPISAPTKTEAMPLGGETKTTGTTGSASNEVTREYAATRFMPTPTKAQALAFPFQWPVSTGVAAVRGTVDEFRTERTECLDQTKSPVLANTGSVIFLPLSAVAGLLRAPVLAGVKVFTKRPFSKEALCVDGELDPPPYTPTHYDQPPK